MKKVTKSRLYGFIDQDNKVMIIMTSLDKIGPKLHLAHLNPKSDLVTPDLAESLLKRGVGRTDKMFMARNGCILRGYISSKDSEFEVEVPESKSPHERFKNIATAMNSLIVHFNPQALAA